MAYTLKLFLIGLATLILGPMVFPLALLDRNGKRAYLIGRIWSWIILKVSGIQVKVEGLSRLQSGKAYIFMANHQSNIDIPVLIHALPKFQLRWLAKRELVFIPVFGWALWASRHIIVDRASRSEAVATLRTAKQRLQAGVSVVVFPEGTRSPDGRLLPFKRGGFIMALKMQAPIVPVAIKGSGSLLPKGDWRLRTGQIEVVVEGPVSVEEYDLKNVGHLVNRVQGVLGSSLSGTVQGGAENAECHPQFLSARLEGAHE
jgi:1-acyl-sn-glycerol-3-phosphate acyltransferase